MLINDVIYYEKMLSKQTGKKIYERDILNWLFE
jgi:hypothetical protein